MAERERKENELDLFSKKHQIDLEKLLEENRKRPIEAKKLN